MTMIVVLLMGAGCACAAASSTHHARERRLERVAARDVPAAASDLARSIRAGATLPVALREIAPTLRGSLRNEVHTAVALLDRGHPLDSVLAKWGRSSRIVGTDLLVAACRFSIGPSSSSAHSRSLDRALDGVANALLDRVEVADEVRALAAQARTSAMVLVALPPAGAALFSVLDPGFLSVLFGTTLGRVCLLVGSSLDAAGAWASRAMVRRVLG